MTLIVRRYRVHETDLGSTSPCLCLGGAIFEGCKAGTSGQRDIADVRRLLRWNTCELSGEGWESCRLSYLRIWRELPVWGPLPAGTWSARTAAASPPHWLGGTLLVLLWRLMWCWHGTWLHQSHLTPLFINIIVMRTSTIHSHHKIPWLGSVSQHEKVTSPPETRIRHLCHSLWLDSLPCQSPGRRVQDSLLASLSVRLSWLAETKWERGDADP